MNEFFFQSISPEKEAEPQKLVFNLFELEPGSPEWQELSERIAKHNGKIVFFVHPFHPRSNNFGPIEVGTIVERIEKYVRELTKQDPDKTPALFLSATHSSLSTFSNYLENLAINNKNKVYLIPTGPTETSATPFLPEQINKETEGLSIDEEISNWAQLSDLFRQLKVTEVEIGGMYLRIYFSSQEAIGLPLGKSEITLGGCVGETIVGLKSFSLKLTDYTYPARRGEIAKDIKERGETRPLEDFLSSKTTEEANNAQG